VVACESLNKYVARREKMSENKELVRLVYEDVRSEGHLHVVDEIFSPDYVGHDPTAEPEEVHGPAGMKEQTAGYRSVFPDLRFRIDSLVEERDEVVARWTARGTHHGSMGGEEPTGSEIEVSGFGSWRIEDGRVVEHWGLFDIMRLLRGIGALPN
jgi:predicted ester cyclase